ncbi:MAG: hypothetical protein ACREIC_31920, partial [Limisphaerales bacterium]
MSTPALSRKIGLAILVTGALAALFVWTLALRGSRTASAGMAQPTLEIRGDPIVAAAQPGATNAPGLGSKPHKRKRPKPASFQHRMVAYNLQQAAGDNTNADNSPSLGGSPARIIYTAAQLAALPELTLPAGYQWIGFDKLSAFPFEVTSQMADGSKNLAAASAETRSKIPPAVLALDGHLVWIRGFLLPLKTNEGLTFDFLLMRNQNMCCFGSVPKVNEWVSIQV